MLSCCFLFEPLLRVTSLQTGHLSHHSPRLSSVYSTLAFRIQPPTLVLFTCWLRMSGLELVKHPEHVYEFVCVCVYMKGRQCLGKGKRNRGVGKEEKNWWDLWVQERIGVNIQDRARERERGRARERGWGGRVHVGACETGDSGAQSVREKEREKPHIGVCWYETERIISQCVDAA